MPTYRYKAVRPDGAIEQGELEAISPPAAAARLQENGWLPVRVDPADAALLRGLRRPRGRALRPDTEAIARELGVLLRAGLPLEQALEALLDIATQPGARKLLEGVLETVRGGDTLSAAIEARPAEFSAVHLGMVKAGEASGRLPEALDELAGYLERGRALRDGVTSALLYPAILVGVALVSLLLLLAWVVPQFTNMFDTLGGTLPLPTRIVIGAGELARDWGWLLPLALLGGAWYLRRNLREPAKRLAWDAWLLRVPLLGDLLLRLETARFARTLGVLVDNGVPLLEALGIAQGTVNNTAMRALLEATARKVQAGRGLAQPLRDAGMLPRLAVRMIAVGEESGRLGPMLLRVADTYDGELRTATTRLLALLEPVLIVGLGVVIAFIVLSIMLAVVGTHELLL